MNINKEALTEYISEVSNYDLMAYEALATLVSHFEYSIKDVNSYEELPDDLKLIINKRVFEFLTTWGNNHGKVI